MIYVDNPRCIECSGPADYVAPAIICKACWREWWDCEDCIEESKDVIKDCAKHAKWREK